MLRFADLERAAQMTKNPELRDRILQLMLDEQRVGQNAEAPVNEQRVGQNAEAPVNEQTGSRDLAGVVTMKELASAMLALVDIQYTKNGAVSTQGRVSRRFRYEFQGTILCKNGFMAVSSTDVGRAFDCLVRLFRPLRAVSSVAIRRIVDSRAALVARFEKD